MIKGGRMKKKKGRGHSDDFIADLDKRNYNLLHS